MAVDAHQDSLDILHTGDIVLLKVSLSKDPYGEAGQHEDDTGYVSADGIRGEVNVIPCDNVEGTGLDIREFLFVVVDQLSYIALRDLARRRKHLLSGSASGRLSSAQSAQLQNYEQRAFAEAEQNDELRRTQRKPLYYGDVVQLLHLRTQRFMGVLAKTPAPLWRTSRRVDLQKGNTSSWLKLNPYFSHKVHGQPIAIGEQVSMQCMKLGGDWCMNWVQATDPTGTSVREVNCAPKGRGFYFNLYSRSVPVHVGSKNLALSFGLTVCMFHPHTGGFISGSSAQRKHKPYIRIPPNSDIGRCSKSVWVIEHVTYELKDQGIMWLQTPVYLRHFASGRYLSVNAEDLKKQFPQEEIGDAMTAARRSVSTRSLTPGVKNLQAELVDLPGPNCVFTLESTSSMKVGDPGEKNFVSREAETCLMLRWEKPPEQIPLWLSCLGTKKGKRGSLELSFSTVRYSRDAIRLDVINSEDPWMLSCDVVAEQATKLRRTIIPLCSNLSDAKVACAVCGVTAHMLCDMIFFLAGSPKWRSVDITDLKQPDGLDEQWISKPQRQQLARELKYINASFELFEEFVKQTPSIAGGEITFASREGALANNTRGSIVDAVNMSTDEENESAVQAAEAMKTRCLKLLVRLWVFCFLNNRENEEYFEKNKWVNIINSLNGHGLGASGVFVSLVSDNPNLIRAVDRQTMLKFISFIRQLGPMDTWLQFLAALCAPKGEAMYLKQQDVLCSLVYAGGRATETERQTASQNREDLLVACRLGSPTGCYLGPPMAGATPPPLEECMAYNLLTEGIHDIAVSWTHPDFWDVGLNVLYHGPEYLNVPRVPTPRGEGEGKAWVSLAQIVWVLQPETCCERALGTSWEEMKQNDGIQTSRSSNRNGDRNSETEHDAPSKKNHRSSQWNLNPGFSHGSGSKFEDLKILAKFFLAQLQLIHGMVRERQVNCILALQEEYSFALCLSGSSDERLPTSIRAAFMDIMRALWVDRHPHFQVVMPSLLRHLPHLQSNRLDDVPTFFLAQEEMPDTWSQDHFRTLPDEVLAFYRLPQPHKMEALLRVLRQYFCAGFSVEQQVHNALEDNELTNSMLRVMSLVLRYGFLYSKSHILELIGPLMRMLDGRSDLLVPLVHRRPSKEAVTQANATALMAEAFTPLLQEQEMQVLTMQRGIKSFTFEHFPPLEDSTDRYADSPANKSMNASKARTLEVILQTMQARDHIRISRILDKAKEFLDENTPMPAGATDQLVSAILEVLEDPVISLKGPGISSPDVMCVDLMMYEDPRLFSLAFELLYQDYMETLTILKRLEGVVILNSRQLELFEILKVDVSAMGRLIYSFENWGVDDQFSTADNQKFQLFQRLCLKIRNLCHLGDASTRPAEIQHMLRETELWTHISYVICLQPIDFMPSCLGLLARVVALVCSVAAQFVSSNAENQATALHSLEQIRKLLATHPDSALLAAEIFRGNFELCHQVSKDLIMEFGDLVVREREQGKFSPWYLTFFRAVCIAGHTPVPVNQGMVLQELLRVGPEKALHLLQHDGGPQYIGRLAQGFRSVGQLTNPEVSRGTTGDDAELIYYIRSLELIIAVASGFGVQSIMCKPFASRVFPPEMAFRLLMYFGARAADKTDNQFSVHRYLKVRWLQFVEAVVYDVDKSLIDLELLISAPHLEFFTVLLQWVQAVVIQPSHGGGGRDTMNEDEEEYLRWMLSCIESFFRNCYTLVVTCSHDHGSGELKFIAEKYQQRLGSMLKSGGGSSSGGRFGLKDPQMLYSCINQINTTVNASPGKDSRRRMTTISIKTVQPVQAQGAQKQWRALLDNLRSNPRIADKIKREEDELGSIFSNITQLTDPELPDYLRLMPHEPGYGLPEDVDFRRSQITTEDALKRMVKHIETRVMTDLEGVARIELVLCVMMRLAREKSDIGDELALPLVHSQFVASGVTDLIIRILDANPSEDITATAWSILSQFLQGRDGVNVDVQQAILDTCMKGDDSGMWVTFAQFLNDVSSQTKVARNLKVAPTISAEEQLVMDEYEESIDNSMKAMEAVRLLVEGHYFPMQQYLYRQEGNKTAHNVPEVAALLFIRMCKDQYAVDILNQIEMDCISCTLNLLIELAQGPNVRNQEFLSTLGLIETVFKVLAANFERFQKTAGDVYPPAVRRLKALGVTTLLTLLEGRLDTRIQNTMLQRSDAPVLRDRIEFVYVYFVCGAFDVGSGKTKSERNAAIPLETDTALLVSDKTDSDRLYDHLVKASHVAEELLEDLDDLELDELFSEGLDVLALIFQLCPHSAELERLVTPLDGSRETFKHSREFYVTEREFLRERTAFQAREIYRFSFDFLSRFVKTIEVMLNGKLQPLHFQRPLTEMWYVHGQAKNHIQNSVPLGSSDTKMKSFIAMCQKAHAESKLVRRLSRFSIMPTRYAKWAQRNLWDGMHRPFQTFFKNDAKNMARSLTFQLLLGLALSLHAGAFLVPIAHIPKVNRFDSQYPPADGLDWASLLMERIAYTMGCMYIGMILVWLIITFCLKAPLKYEDIVDDYAKNSHIRVACVASYQTLTSPTIAWRIVLLFSCSLSIFFQQYWLYSFLVADFFCQNSSLGTVLTAIVNKGYSLSMTFLGAVLITYVYSGFAFHYFREEFQDHCNENVLYCCANIIYQGTRNGIIGLSSMMDEVMPHDPKFFVRVVFDVSYFIVFGIMLLNTIVALIVDSFSALRMETEARDHNNETQTFISCIDRKVIETVAQAAGIADGWFYHEHQKQNKWDYMAFIFHLGEKNAEDYTGPEQSIREMIENKDVKWLPIDRSMMLEADEEHGTKEDILVRIEKNTVSTMGQLSTAKEHRAMMTRAVNTLRSHVDERFDTCDEEMAQIHAGIQKRRHDQTKANLAMLQAERAGAGQNAFVGSLTGTVNGTNM